MLNVKPFRQSPSLCGPATLKMVAEYYGIRKSEKLLAKLSKSTESGTKAENLIKAAEKIGLDGFIRNFSDINDIRKYVVGKKIPVIVEWFSTDEGHYSPVVGINKKNIYLQDSEFGHVRVMKIDVFKRVWFDFPGDFLKSKKDIIIRRLVVIYKP